MGGVESSIRNQGVIACNLSRVQRVLCLGAHSDDIEIGCGGTVLRMIEQSKSIEFYWLVLSANPMRAKEAEQSANAFLGGARHKTVVVNPFAMAFFPTSVRQLRKLSRRSKRSSFRTSFSLTSVRIYIRITAWCAS